MKKGIAVLMMAILAVAAFSIPTFAEVDSCSVSMNMGVHEKMMGAGNGKMDKKMDLEDMFFSKVSMIKENADELGISDDQMQKIKMLKASVKKNIIKSDADLGVLAIDIDVMLGQNEVDVARINALIDKKYDAKSMAAKSLVGSYADLKKVLTKDQMKKLSDIRKNDRMGEGKGMMMGGKKEHGRKMDMKN